MNSETQLCPLIPCHLLYLWSAFQRHSKARLVQEHTWFIWRNYHKHAQSTISSLAKFLPKIGHDYTWSLVGTSCRSYTNNPSIDTSSLTMEQQTQKTLHKNRGKIKQSTAPDFEQKKFRLNEEKYLSTWPKQSKILSDRFKKKCKSSAGDTSADLCWLQVRFCERLRSRLFSHGQHPPIQCASKFFTASEQRATTALNSRRWQLNVA